MRIKTIAVDSEGLDLGYEVALNAAKTFAKEHSDIMLRIFVLEENLENAQKIVKNMQNITLIPSKLAAKTTIESKIILNNTQEALRKFQETGFFECDYSMANVLFDTYQNRSQACLVPGHTGHILFLSRLMERHFGKFNSNIPQCLITPIPNQNNKPKVALDLGGIVDQNLYKLAVMGSLYAKHFLKIENPKVGFLNIGSEMNKGKAEIREAAIKYGEAFPGSLYGQHGFIEPNEIFGGNDCNVIVTDGFTGNAVIKSAEGALKVFINMIRAGVKKSLIGYLVAIPMKRILTKILRIIDPNRTPAALFGGFSKPIIKCHGYSNETAIYHSFETARLYIDDFPGFLKDEMRTWENMS